MTQNKLTQGITLRYEVRSGGLFGLWSCYRLCVAKGYAFRRLDLWFRFATKPIRITKQVSAGYNPALRIHLRTYPSRSLYLPEFNLQSLFLIQAPSAICRQDQSGSKRKNRRRHNQYKHNAAIPRFGQASFWIAANIGVIYNRRLVFDRRSMFSLFLFLRDHPIGNGQ